MIGLPQFVPQAIKVVHGNTLPLIIRHIPKEFENITSVLVIVFSPQKFYITQGISPLYQKILQLGSVHSETDNSVTRDRMRTGTIHMTYTTTVCAFNHTFVAILRRRTKGVFIIMLIHVHDRHCIQLLHRIEGINFK
jgi:hypothetical protein